MLSEDPRPLGDANIRHRGKGKAWSWRRCVNRKIATQSRRDGAESLRFVGGAPDGNNTARYLGKYVLIFSNIDMKRGGGSSAFVGEHNPPHPFEF